ncbi:MAG: branched-chain-amino-acid transaminase [Candidatus Omnitrophota bacterium]
MSSTVAAISINFQLCAPEEAKISIFDHGFLYGDGVFEGIRVYRDKIFRGERHVARLFRSAKVIDLNIGYSQQEILDELRRVVHAWAEKNSVSLQNNGDPLYIRLIVSRGDGDLGLDPRKCPKPNIIVVVTRLKLYPKEFYEKGLSLVTTAIRRNPVDSLPPQVKSLNYLNNVLAKLDANREGAAEAIFLNHEGYVVEATADNLFIVNGGAVSTPPITDGALPGITREAVIDLAGQLGIPCRETHVTLADLFGAEECFVTGTAARVVPVTAINARAIGSGAPGPVTLKLAQAFVALTENDGIAVYG